MRAAWPCRPATRVLHVHSTFPRPGAPRGSRPVQVTCALFDPWATLGVPKDASEKEIKKAHRKLVLETHPDVKGRDDPVVQARFMRIQEAYELVMGKRAGKDVDNRPTDKSGWQFHDWYWKFSMKRRKGKGPFGAAAAGAFAEEPPEEVLRHQWQSQLAGLRQKAAAKRTRRPQQAQAAASAPRAGQAAAAAAREDIWRSTTKNARRTSQAAAPPTAPATAAAGSLAAERGTVGQATVAATQPGQPQPPPQTRTAVQQPPPASHVGSARDLPPHHHAVTDHQQYHHHHPHQVVDGHHLASVTHEAATTSASHVERLREMLERAAQLVQPTAHAPVNGGHEAQHAQHAQHGEHTLFSRVARFGAHGRVTLDQLATLLGGHRPEGSSQGTTSPPASSAVAADAQLRERLKASMRHHSAQHAQHTPVATPGSDPPEEEERLREIQELRSREQAHHRSAHAHKFANRDEVEGRLSSQLAGLKRRAALRHEVESNC